MLFAVHIPDGVLSLPACLVGFAVAGALAAIGAWRIRDEEVPRVGVMTSALFVGSSLHVPLPPSSVHLLLNGLAGVLLGWRVALAIPVALALQAVLLGHGGFLSLGVNACVMVVPALLAAPAFRLLQYLQSTRFAWLRSAFVGITSVVWIMSLAVGLLLLFASDPDSEPAKRQARDQILQPQALMLLTLAGIIVAVLERRWNRSPDFAIGLLIGLGSVLVTIVLSLVALLYGGETSGSAEAPAVNLTRPAWLLFVAHLPLAALEGLILGFTLSFLARVKPEMLPGKLLVGQDSNAASVPAVHANGPPLTASSAAAETLRPAAPPIAPDRD